MAFAASCKAAAALPAALRQAGCFDHEVKLPATGATARAAILSARCAGAGLALSPAQLTGLAAKAEGFDASDLQLLVDRAMHAALSRRLSTALSPAPPPPASSKLSGTEPGSGAVNDAASMFQATSDARSTANGGLEVTDADLAQALAGFTPAAFWSVQKSAGA